MSDLEIKKTNQYLLKRLTDDVVELKKELNEIKELVSYIKEEIIKNTTTPETKGWIFS
tara:strand:+ start:1376 stop:1549 length:174 start_codon:yes stop_codon:yes gene_type:complete